MGIRTTRSGLEGELQADVYGRDAFVAGAPPKPKPLLRFWETGIVQDGRFIWAGICANTQTDGRRRDRQICQSAAIVAAAP